MKKRNLCFFAFLSILMSLFSIACTMEGGSLFSAKKHLTIQSPPENAIIKDTFVMNGRILTDKSIELIEVSFTEIGALSPKNYGPFSAVFDQTENKWVLDFESLETESFLLPDGKYEVSLESYDINQNKTRQTFIYYIDNSLPLLLLTSPVSEDQLSPWEFNSRLIFTGFLFDKSPFTTLIFSFYNEEKEFICEHREEFPSGQWTLEVGRNNALYQSLKNSGSQFFYYTVEAEDAAREYKSAFWAFDSMGNKSDGFYLMQDFVSENIHNASDFSRSLFSMLSEESLTYDEVSFFSTKDDLLSKKRIHSLDELENQRYFKLNFGDYAPYIISQRLILQTEDSAFKNIVSAQESLLFEFHNDNLGAVLSEDMSYSLKRKEGEDWVPVFQTGEKMISTIEQSLNQKIDVDYTKLHFGENLIYVHDAPEVLGDYKLEFFLQDTSGISARDTVWYFTVVEPSPSLYIEIKEINFENQEIESILIGLSSISDAKDTVLTVKNLAGVFDEMLIEQKAKDFTSLGNGLYSLNWDILLHNIRGASSFSNLIFEVKSLGKQNRLYKDFSSIWFDDQNISSEDEWADLSEIGEFTKNFDSSMDIQEFIQMSFEEMIKLQEEKVLLKPSIKLGENNFDIEIHYDYKGSYFNLAYVDSQIEIPFITNEAVKEVYINHDTQIGKSLGTNLVELEPGLWQLSFEEPQESVQEILELVAVNNENLSASLRIKVIFDKDAPFVKIESLKNNFYNKEKPLYISGLCLDFTAGRFQQSGIEPIIEYAVFKNDEFEDEEDIENLLNWDLLEIENPLAWDFDIDPELFEEDGLYSVCVRVKDKSGNYSSLTDASVISIYVDSQAPVITIDKNDDEQVSDDLKEDEKAPPASEKIVFESPHVLTLEGTIDEKSFLENGLAYWALEKVFSPISGTKVYEKIEMMEFTFGNHWGFEDILEQKGQYFYRITAIDLAGNEGSADYSLFVK